MKIESKVYYNEKDSGLKSNIEDLIDEMSEVNLNSIEENEDHFLLYVEDNSGEVDRGGFQYSLYKLDENIKNVTTLRFGESLDE